MDKTNAPAFRVDRAAAGSMARTGSLTTPHGVIRTPAFVPVATRATVKSVEPAPLAAIGVQVLICNTYHLHLVPGEDVVHELGGLAVFSGWDGPTMTDSGGFQVFSLGAGKVHGVGKVASVFPDEVGGSGGTPRGGSPSLVRLTEEGVRFRSILDGSWHTFSPEGVVELQRKLGADIALVLDECTSPLHDREYTRAAMERTHRWAERAACAFRPRQGEGQLQYGIVQGGAFHDLREESARVIASMGFDGVAIGGSLGRSKEDMRHVLDWVVPLLPADLPRHLLGIGEIEDIFATVSRGVDTLDCAAATRMARNGSVLLKGAPRHRLHLRNAAYRSDPRPIDPTCDCPACRNHSRAYLRHLLRAGELSFARLATLHNLRAMTRLMASIREALDADALNDLAASWGVAID